MQVSPGITTTRSIIKHYQSLFDHYQSLFDHHKSLFDHYQSLFVFDYHHQEVECYNYCCEAVVKNWAYTVLSLIAPLLSIPMTVPEHIPGDPITPPLIVIFLILVGLSGSSTLEYLSSAGTLSSVRSSSIVSGDTDSVKSASFAASFPSSQVRIPRPSQ